MPDSLTIPLFIDHEREGTYFTVPFTMPPGIKSFHLSYHYQTHDQQDNQVDSGVFRSKKRLNIIDLGILAPDGSQAGASGSDKSEIEISESFATPGYHPCPLVEGEWNIIVGAYHVAPEGVEVRYELSFKPKELHLYQGDLHVHTLASDGVLTLDELAHHAHRNGLDFLAITDHNQMVSPESFPYIPDITLIPGIEWTHYQGHANFLGVEKPYDGSFMANTLEEVQMRFHSARARGATIIINHPFDEQCGFNFDLQKLPFDCIEVWNGPMRESNLRSVGLWQMLLTSGRKIPICGGSDYHRDTLFLFSGGPTTCIYSLSAGPTDLLQALRQGHAYITFAPDALILEMKAGPAILGDSVPFVSNREIHISLEGLQAGDVVNVITKDGQSTLLKADASGKFQGAYTMQNPGFARLEVLRSFVPGLPLLPALISNPIYFDPE